MVLALAAPNKAPEITYFYTFVSPGGTLWVDGFVEDEDLEGVTVYITWLDETYEVDVASYGYFFWYTDLEEGDEGWITAVARDSEGLESEPWEDLILPY
jgi:hypothetical protein